MNRIFVPESTSSGTSARTWHAQVATWLFRRKVDEVELPILKEAHAQPFSLLGEAAALGETPVLPGGMVGPAHFQHPWGCMQLGGNWGWGGQHSPFAWEHTVLGQTVPITNNELGCSVISFVFKHRSLLNVIQYILKTCFLLILSAFMFPLSKLFLP